MEEWKVTRPIWVERSACCCHGCLLSRLALLLSGLSKVFSEMTVRNLLL